MELEHYQEYKLHFIMDWLNIKSPENYLDKLHFINKYYKMAVERKRYLESKYL